MLFRSVSQSRYGFVIIFVLLALSLFGLYEVALPARWMSTLSAWSGKQKGGHFISVFVMGVLSTLIVSPCVSAPVVGILIYIASTGNQVLGAASLFALGLGMGLPLLVVGTSAGRYLPRAGQWMKVVKALFGVMLLAVAIFY